MNRNLVWLLASFVRHEFGVSRAEIVTALHHCDTVTQLPIVLWQYGFITIQQLDRLFDWLEGARVRSLDHRQGL